MNSIFKPIILTVFLALQVACGIYSFTGATIEVDTISIAFFENRASLINPTLSQTFTESLKDRFISQSKLTLVDLNGEWQIKGAITNYRISPIAATANQASLNRLTIDVKVDFKDITKEGVAWTQGFSRFADFDATQSLNSVEETLVEEVNEQLVNDIFNKVAVNW